MRAELICLIQPIFIMKYLFLFITAFISNLTVNQFYEADNLFFEEELLPDSLCTISISAVGDLMCHSTQFNYARVTADSFDFNPVFDGVREYLQSSDLTIGNLETVIGGKEKGFRGYPFFNSPDEFLEALPNAGFDILMTANNHSFDMGKDGLIRTLSKINQLGMMPIGTFKNSEDRDSIRIIEKNNIKLAILGYTYSLNGLSLPQGMNYLINQIDTLRIKSDIEKVKKTDYDVLMVFYHFGDEYQRYPSGYQKEIVNKTIYYGADIILASHPHVVQPIEYFKTNSGKLDTGFVFYSLGNFLSNQRWRYSDGGVIAQMSLEKNLNSNRITLKEFHYIPIWVFKGTVGNLRKYIVFPSEISSSEHIPDYFSPADISEMRQSFDDTVEICEAYSSKPKLFRIYPDEIKDSTMMNADKHFMNISNE